MTAAAEKVAYLAGRLRDLQAEALTTEEALHAAMDAWAQSLSTVRVGERVDVVGVPPWPAQVICIRAARFRDPPDEPPTVVVEVQYVRKDGSLGRRRALFFDGRDIHMKWALRPHEHPAVATVQSEGR